MKQLCCDVALTYSFSAFGGFPVVQAAADLSHTDRWIAFVPHGEEISSVLAAKRHARIFAIAPEMLEQLENSLPIIESAASYFHGRYASELNLPAGDGGKLSYEKWRKLHNLANSIEELLSRAKS